MADQVPPEPERPKEIHRRPKLKLPPAASRKEWKDLERHLSLSVKFDDKDLERRPIAEVLVEFTDSIYDALPKGENTRPPAPNERPDSTTARRQEMRA